MMALGIELAAKTGCDAGEFDALALESCHRNLQIDRLLNPKNNSATLETLMRAAKIVGRELRLELA